MNSISAHGGLVHVELFVKSVTSKGITVLVTHSPELMIFHVFLDDEPFELLDQNLEATLKETFTYRKLFICGSYVVEELLSAAGMEYLDRIRADLVSFWK